MGAAETSGQCLCPNGSGPVTLASTRKAIKGRDQQPKYHSILRRQSFSFYDGSDPQDCINSCRESFFGLLLNTSTSEDDKTDSTPPQVCSLLSGAAVSQSLWQLYWCDSAFCGVGIEPGTSGQDPNVDLVINQCQNIGFSSVYDPGSPASDYSCSSLLTAFLSANSCQGAAAASARNPFISSILATPAVAPASSHISTPSPAPTAIATATAGSSLTSYPSTATGSTVSAATTKGTSQLGSDLTMSSRDGPSPEIKAVIIVCVVIGFLILAALIFLLLRQRRKSRISTDSNSSKNNNNKNRSDSNSHLKYCLRQSQLYFFPKRQHRARATSELPTPLISPVRSRNSAASSARPSFLQGQNGLSSPSHDAYGPYGRSASIARHRPSHPRRDPHRGRSRFLPAMLFRKNISRGTSPPLTSLSPPPSPTTGGGGGNGGISGGFYGYTDTSIPYYFPSSPICAPTTNKLEPRREATPTLWAYQSSSQETNQRQKQPKQQQQQQQNSRSIHYNSHRTAPPLSLSLSLLPAAAGSSGKLNSRSSSCGASPPSSPAVPASIYGHALTTDAVDPMVVLPAVVSPYYDGGGGPAHVSPASALSTRGFSPNISSQQLSPPLPSTFPPKSPSRPPRPHETPLEIPGLVMPDTPPPVVSPSLVKAARASTSSPFFSSTAAQGSTRDRIRDSKGDDDGDGGNKFSFNGPPSRGLPPLPPQSPPLLIRDDDLNDGAWVDQKWQPSREPPDLDNISASAVGGAAHILSFSPAATTSTLASMGLSAPTGGVLYTPSSPTSLYSTETDDSSRTVLEGKETHDLVASYAPTAATPVS